MRESISGKKKQRINKWTKESYSSDPDIRVIKCNLKSIYIYIYIYIKQRTLYC